MVRLPKNFVSYTLQFKLFGSPMRIITENSSVPYGIVDIKRDKDTILFRPKPPRDF